MVRRTPTPRNAAPRATQSRPRAARRGTAAMLAMLYLVLFSTLALGFFAAFTLATQTSYNERNARRALASAESGMEFTRYHLWALNIAPTTPSEELFQTVADQLGSKLNGTANLGGGSIGRHDDRCRDAEDLRRERHCLRVIP